jgi:predicted transcriptional regulator
MAVAQTEEVVQKIYELEEQGYTRKQIRETLGLGETTVRKYLNNREVKRIYSYSFTDRQVEIAVEVLSRQVPKTSIQDFLK